jgi:hypothetical protein
VTDDGDGIVTRDGTAVSPKSNRNFDQAAARAAAFFRFLRQPNKPNAPRPVANSGRAAGRRAALGEVRLNRSLLTTALYSSRQTLLGLAEQFFPSRNPRARTNLKPSTNSVQGRSPSYLDHTATVAEPFWIDHLFLPLGTTV